MPWHGKVGPTNLRWTVVRTPRGQWFPRSWMNLRDTAIEEKEGDADA